jgi:hypothetical protein
MPITPVARYFGLTFTNNLGMHGLGTVTLLANLSPYQEIIAQEVNYFRDHREHIHYEDRETEGAPLRRGAVESLGKQLQRRVRGCGEFWERPGLSNLLKLSVLVKNNDLHFLWN